MTEKTLRIFVSSPSDVFAERARVKLVADRLNGELEGRVRLEVLRWEDAFYTAAHSFQEAIDAALGNMSATDMVLCIVWKRAGLKLNPRIWHRPDGSTYESGTVLEFETAVEVSRKHSGIPDVYLFRKTADVLLRADRANEEMEQYQLLQAVWKRWTESPEGYNTAGYQSFVDADDFEEKLEACLRQWLERRGVVAKGPVWDRALKGSPFRGLAAFEASHANVFFGRESAIARATAKLRNSPFLLVIGASGSGKSSLVRAGVVPRATAPGAIAEIDAWRAAIITASSDPLIQLAEALFTDNALGAELRLGDFKNQHALADLFAAPGVAAIAPIRSALARTAEARKEMLRYEAARPAKLLLVIDQLERLFVETEPGRVELFAGLLRNLVEAGLASVIAVLRSDTYGRFQVVESFLTLLENNGATLDLLPPTPSELEDIVTRPVAACHPSLSYETGAQGRSLAEILVADAKGGDALPLLQMTLQRLYDAQERRGDGVLRFADYPGMAAAVTRTAEEALAKLDQDALASLPRLMTALVRDVTIAADGSLESLTIVPVSRAEFERGDLSRKALIDEFVAQRLLTTEEIEGTARVRPVHEALLRVVPAAVAVIKENAALIRVRHTLEPMVAEWTRAGASAKADFLATSPALLAGSAQLLERFGEDLPQELRSFISDSLAADTQRRDRERRRQRRILTATAAELVVALTLAGLAAWQWQVARAQRERAQTALTAATNTAETLVFDLAREFKTHPGMPVDLVNSILERVGGLQRQLAGAGSTPDLRRLEAVSLNELSDLFLGQGNLPAALNAAQRSLSIMEELVKEFPQLPLLQRDLAISLNQLGDVRRAEQNWTQALEAYRRALAIVEKFVAINPDDVRWQRDLWLSYNKIADVQAIAGPRDEALATYRRGLAAVATLVAKYPDNTTLRGDLAFNYNRIAILVGAEGDYAQALEMYQKALTIHEELAAAEPTNTDRKRDVFVSYNRVAGALSALGRREEAIATFRKAIALMEQLAPTDAGNAQWQRDLAGVYDQVGKLLAEAGQSGEALQIYQKLLASRQRLVAITPSNLQWQYDLAADYLKVGDMLSAAGQREESLALYRRGVPIFELLAAADPANLERQRNLTIALLRVGDALAGEEKWLEARAAYERCREIRERLAPANPDNLLLQRDLAFILERVADTFSKAKDYEPALDRYRRALGIREAVVKVDTKNVTYQRELALSHSLVAEVLVELGRKEEEQAEFRAAFAVAERYAATEPDNSVLQMDLVTALYRLAYYIDEESEQHHARARAIVQRLEATGKLSPAQKAWAEALERWLASKPA